MQAIAPPTAVVVSDVYGQRGGAYRVTSLLCEMLGNMGITTTCFASWVDSDSQPIGDGHRMVTPWINKGYRWDLPNRVLARQAFEYIRRNDPSAVFVIGLTKLCGYLLKSTVADRLLVWELTNADPHNKFVCPEAVLRLNRAKAVLSPSKIIDQGIRSTYQYTGEIKRFPFWIDADGAGYRPAPQSFVADFLFLARREDDKGLRELIQATAMLAKDRPDVRVMVGGPGDETPYLDLAKDLRVENNIVFRSLPSRVEAMETLAAVRYLVLPSYHEGYPLSLLEAAQKSVPFIATSVGSIPEVFSGCDGCTIVPPRDTNMLYCAMRDRMSEDADAYVVYRRAVHDRFTRLSSQSSVQSMITEVIASR